MTSGPVPPPPPSYGPTPTGPTAGERNWALASHVGTLVAAWIAMGFLCPLVIMLVKQSSPFVRRHAVESLNFQISLLIYLVIGVILAFAVIGIPLLLLLGIFALIVIILATVAASNGRDYRYPLCIRMVK